MLIQCFHFITVTLYIHSKTQSILKIWDAYFSYIFAALLTSSTQPL